MDELILRAEPRTVVGKKVKQLRRAGLVPAVVYGPGLNGGDTIQLTVNRRDFDRFYMSHGHSTLFALEWEGGRQQVFIREVQEEPIKRTALHIDFFAPNMRKELTAPVPVVLRNPADHIDGVLTQVRAELEVSALPRAIPSEIDVDVSGLATVGDSIRAGDLSLPKGVTLVTAEDEVIASVVAETVVEEEPTEEETEGEEAEGGEAAEGETEGEAGESGSTDESES